MSAITAIRLAILPLAQDAKNTYLPENQRTPRPHFAITLLPEQSSSVLSSLDEKKLLSLIDDVKDLMAKNWSLKNRSAFVKGKRYYWVTVNAKGYLRTIHSKCGVITDNVANMRYNYFEQEQDA